MDGDPSQPALLLRKEFSAMLNHDSTRPGTSAYAHHEQLRSRIIAEQRRALVELRTQDAIGDQAFHEIEARLDLAELSVRTPD